MSASTIRHSLFDFKIPISIWKTLILNENIEPESHHHSQEYEGIWVKITLLKNTNNNTHSDFYSHNNMGHDDKGNLTTTSTNSPNPNHYHEHEHEICYLRSWPEGEIQTSKDGAILLRDTIEYYQIPSWLTDYFGDYSMINMNSKSKNHQYKFALKTACFQWEFITTANINEDTAPNLSLKVSLISNQDNSWFPTSSSSNHSSYILNMFKRQLHEKLISNNSIVPIIFHNIVYLFRIEHVCEILESKDSNNLPNIHVNDNRKESLYLLTMDTLDKVTIVHKNISKDSSKIPFFPGYHQEFLKLKRYIDDALLKPNAYQRLGLSYPRTFLLNGEYGIGKKTILRYLFEHYPFYQLNLDCSSLIGEPEHRKYMISKLEYEFYKAKSMSPCILILENLENLIEGNTKSIHSAFKTLVLNNLARLLKSNQNDQVVIIAVTSNKQDIQNTFMHHEDEMFQYHVDLMIPNGTQRKEILEHQLNKLFSETIDTIPKQFMDDMNDLMQGYTAGEIHSFFKTVHDKLKTKISFHDTCYNTIRTLQPSSKKSLSFNREQKIQKIKLDDFSGYNKIKKKLSRNLTLSLEHPEIFDKLGIQPKNGILIYGPTGCGKTMLVKALAESCRHNFLQLESHEVFSKYFGDSEKKIREIFQSARKAAPCIVFIDDIDNLGLKRGEDAQSGVHERILSTLLNEMDGVAMKGQVFVVGCTNRPYLLDEALLRPGRLDLHVLVDLPTESDRHSILKSAIEKSNFELPDYEGTEWQAIIKNTNGLTCVDLISLVRLSRNFELSINFVIGNTNNRLDNRESCLLTISLQQTKSLTIELLTIILSYAGLCSKHKSTINFTSIKTTSWRPTLLQHNEMEFLKEF